MRTLTILLATLCIAASATACEVKSVAYRKSVDNSFKLNMDIQGCTRNQSFTLKFYEDGEFLGSVHVYGHDTSTYVDVNKPLKSINTKKVTMTVTSND